MNKKKVAIIGAGLSGLITAKLLSKDKYDITIFEKESMPGGRMRTIIKDKWQLDLGFQVLLTGYPYLKKYADLSSLNVLNLEPGATIFGENKTSKLGDPGRNLSFLFPTLFSFAGTLKDKFLVFKLNMFVKKRSIDELFALENKTTLEFLDDFGFSDQIIGNFFRPFYSGIFLEDELRTSSRMFLFIFKMFSEGDAVIPKGGIGELCSNLANGIDDINIEFNTVVTSIENNTVRYNNSEKAFDIIINTNPTFNNSSRTQWKSCHVFYFEHEGEPIIQGPMIGLIAQKNKLINNIFYAHLSQTDKPSDKALLSLTVVNDQNLSIDALKEKVYNEASSLIKKRLDFVEHYSIPKSLPDLSVPKNDIELDINRTIHIGDYVLNGSQNAACKIAEIVAQKLNS